MYEMFIRCFICNLHILYEVYGSPKHVMIAGCERSHSIYFYPAISRHHAAIKSVDGETCKFLISWLIGWFFLKLDRGLNKGIFDAVQFGGFFYSCQVRSRLRCREVNECNQLSRIDWWLRFRFLLLQ